MTRRIRIPSIPGLPLPADMNGQGTHNPIRKIYTLAHLRELGGSDAVVASLLKLWDSGSMDYGRAVIAIAIMQTHKVALLEGTQQKMNDGAARLVAQVDAMRRGARRALRLLRRGDVAGAEAALRELARSEKL